MRNFSEISSTESPTHILHSTLFFPENRAVYQIVGKKYGRAGQATDNIIWRMRTAC